MSTPPKLPRPRKETPDQFRARQNLRMLSEVYRNHWELFVKGFALYLAACSALTGVAAAHSADKPLNLFCGVAIIVGSAITIGATLIANSFMKTTKEKVDRLAEEALYVSFMTSDPLNAVVLLRWIAAIICIAGF